MWQAEDPVEAVMGYGLLIILLISAWETYKAVRRHLESKKYVWMAFDTPEEASIAAQLIYDWERTGLDDISDVEFDVSWHPRSIFDNKVESDPSPARIKVRVPNSYLAMLYSNAKFHAGEELFRAEVKEKING